MGIDEQSCTRKLAVIKTYTIDDHFKYNGIPIGLNFKINNQRSDKKVPLSVVSFFVVGFRDQKWR